MDDLEATGSDDRTKACPRGHWRPGEDGKLRRLVEQYGPQNWNSIAEKLQGRSGSIAIYMSSNQYISLYWSTSFRLSLDKKRVSCVQFLFLS